MSPTGFIEVCSLGVFTKIEFYFCKLLTKANILRILKKNSKNLIFWWGWEVRVKKKKQLQISGARVDIGEAGLVGGHVLEKSEQLLGEVVECEDNLGAAAGGREWAVHRVVVELVQVADLWVEGDGLGGDRGFEAAAGGRWRRASGCDGSRPQRWRLFWGHCEIGCGGGLFWEMDLNVGAWKGAREN